MFVMHRNLWFAAPAAALAIQLAACSSDTSVEQTEEPVTCECPIEWVVDNTTVCGAPSEASTEGNHPPLIYSTVVEANGAPACGTEPETFPPPVPAAPWSKQRISSMCGGSGMLCVSLRQGDWEHPKDDDCVLARQCTAFTYEGGGQILELPPLSAWTVSDAACAYKFEANDGYLEFENDSNLGCEAVIQKRLCPLSCATDRNTEECQTCLSEIEPSFNTES
jgi:hypothetical protein